ncbi:hypothetical protein [Lysobacter fragariae]
MTHHVPPTAARSAVLALAITLTIAALAGCATTQATTAALVVGQETMFEGEVVGVDTAPWAYDGNASVTVTTPSAATVQVQLPARWNLCKAAPPGDVQALKPHDRVQVAGTVTAPDTVVVCSQPQHHLRKVGD